MTLINTRDCFAFDLIVRETKVDIKTGPIDKPILRKGIIKREFFFSPDNLPENYTVFIDKETEKMFKKCPEERQNPYNYPAGCVSYENFFSNEELKDLERNVELTEELCKNRAFLPMTAQQTFSRL